MADVLIERARNIRTRQEETPDKANQADAYFCVKCGQEVTLIPSFMDKNAIRYQQHFRHRPHAQVLDCEWRSEAEVREIRDAALREFSDEVARRRLRLFLERDAFGDGFGLFGAIRSLSPVEFADIRAAAGGPPLNHLRVECDGAIRQPLPQEILPTAGLLRVPLRPDANGYVLRIDAPGSFELKGSWTAPSLGSNAIFVGQEDSAELVTNLQYVAAGQMIFILTPRKDNIPEGAIHVRLGKQTLIGVEVTRDLEQWLKERVKTLQAIATNPLRVSVLLPFLHDPRAERFVRVERDARCILAVTPPVDRDPALEVVGWTGGSFEQVTLVPTGPGQPRFIEFDSGAAPTNLLIHWPGYRGRDVRLQIAPTERRPDEKRATIPDFGVQDETGRRALAEFHEELQLEPVMTGDGERPIRAPRIELLGFAQMEVGLAAIYPDSKGAPRLVDEGIIKSEHFSEKVNAIFESGAGRIVVDFDTLGRITLDFDYFFDQRVKRERQDYDRAEKLRAIRENARPAPPKPKVQEEPVRPDPLKALEQSVRAKQRSFQQERQEITGSPPATIQPKDRYSRLMADAALLRRLRTLRPFPPKATQEFAARFLGLSETKSNLSEIRAWRNPINRYIRDHPEDVRRPRKDAVVPPTAEPQKRRHHDDRPRVHEPAPAPIQPSDNELEMTARMPGETRETELERLHKLRERVLARIVELESESVPKAEEDTAPASEAPKSKRAALKAEREKVEPREGMGERADAQTLTPERAHSMMRTLDKRLSAVEDELPAELGVKELAALFECSESIATALRRKYGGRIDVALVRERRKRDA